MEQKLSQKLVQTQKLIITPQLLQSLKIMQISRLELVDLIHQEMQENPVLEEREKTFESTNEFVNEFAKTEETEEKDESISEEKENLPDVDFDWVEDFSFTEKENFSQDKGMLEKNFLENISDSLPSLQETLLWQLRLTSKNDIDWKIGEEIIGNIDDNGYLNNSLEEISEKLNLDIEKVYDVLLLIQTFDPIGVGARNLRESLLIQKRDLNIDNPLLGRIILNCYDKITSDSYSEIAGLLNTTISEVKEAIEIIAKLEPYPGLKYNNEKPKYIIPDILIEKIEDTYEIIFNTEGIPPLKINTYYKKILAEKNEIELEFCKYIQNKIRRAKEIIKSIEQRKSTIYKIAQSIFFKQEEFLEKGIQYLKPLNLQQIAEMIGMHISTISRAVTDKYVQTPQGVFELKYFFSSGIKQEGMQSSSISIKEMMKEIINEENVYKPYTDNEIVEIFKKKEINIARRTIVKYREDMGILSSNKRKRKNGNYCN
ncbi:MAG: RNA polymerase factor sigma-54 [bacterium]